LSNGLMSRAVTRLQRAFEIRPSEFAPMESAPFWKLVLIVARSTMSEIVVPAVALIPLSKLSDAPFMKLMPINPLPTSLIDRFRRFTVIPAPLMLMPLVSAARTEPNVPLQSIVIDFVIVTAPKPPGSTQSISPLGAV